MNKNVEYEKFTQEIYQSLINAQGKETIEVKHDLKLQGKSGQNHQIDVYWEFEIAGVKHKVAIECKNYNKTISIGKVRDFKSVVDDIGNVIGIIVTKVGFQKGSKDFAKHYGIQLKVLRKPIEEDWNDVFRMLHFDLIWYILKNITRTVQLDRVWVMKNIDRNKFHFITSHQTTPDTKIVDDKGNSIKILDELEKELPMFQEEKQGLQHVFNLENSFLEIEEVGKVKIEFVNYIYDIGKFVKRTHMEPGKNTKALIKDAITGEKRFIENDGSIK